MTWFYDQQPGFLDFRYRILALSRHYSVTVFLRSDAFRAQFDAPGLAFEVVDERGSGTSSLLRYIRRTSNAIRRSGFDATLLLGAQLAMALYLLPGRPVGLYWNEHPTHTFHGGRWGPVSALANRIFAALSFRAARRASLAMPIGEAHRDDLAEHGVLVDTCRMIYMGADASFAAVAASRLPPLADRPLSVIYTGTVAADRGRDVMLEGLAWALANGARCTLTLVGASEDQLLYCQRRVRELGISDATTLLGRVPGQMIPELLARADAGVCIWEDRVWWRYNPPTKLFEYLCAGLPVLASNIRTHTRYVVDEQNGLVFDYDPLAFGRTLVRLSSMREHLPVMSQAAAAYGAQFAWPQIEPLFLKTVEGFLFGPLRRLRNAAETPDPSGHAL